MKTGLRYTLAGMLGGPAIDALLRTVRIAVENNEAHLRHTREGQPVIFVIWHGRLLVPTYYHRNTNVVALASRSADGEYITRLLQRWGYGVARGSSSRGGEAGLRELVRAIRSGRSAAITPDGPRGPLERIKPGVLQLAQLTGAPIVPVAAAATRAWWFVSWDRFLVPKPFARVHIAHGDSIAIARNATQSDLDEATAHIERVMGELMAHVEAQAGVTRV